MIREAVNSILINQGISQSSLCSVVGLLPQNLNAFIRGRRSIPFESLVSIMDKLRLTIGSKQQLSGKKHIKEARQIISDHIDVCGINTAVASKQCHLHISTITRFLNGIEPISSHTFEKILNGLNMKVIPYSK